MKLYSITATHGNKKLYLTVEYSVSEHDLETTFSFEEESNFIFNISKPYLTHNKEEVTKLLEHLKNNKNDFNFKFEGVRFENYYTYFDSFELKEFEL